MREIRKVPKNWQHPKNEYNQYIPMCSMEFYEEYKKWVTIEEYIEEHWDSAWYEYGLDTNNYTPNWDWYQLYECVSEWTPITPPFETLEELRDWLINNNDYWDNKWSESAIDNMLSDWFAMSWVFVWGTMYSPNETINF